MHIIINYHNAQAAPTPWAGKKLSFQEKSWLQKNQIVLLKFCLSQNEDVTWKFFGNTKIGQLGWPLSEIDLLWASSVQYYCQFNAGVSSIYKDYQATYKGEKRKEMMWIQHFVILQMFHPKFCRAKNILFKHKNSGLFVCWFTHKETQEYVIFSMILQGTSGCGWVNTIDIWENSSYT